MGLPIVTVSTYDTVTLVVQGSYRDYTHPYTVTVLVHRNIHIPTLYLLSDYLVVEENVHVKLGSIGVFVVIQ